jgi:Rrf2 family protein
MLSRKARYALRALSLLARHRGPGGVPLSEISRQTRASAAFLSPILLDLRRRGLLVSFRGRTGGYALARPADTTSFASVLRAVDGAFALAPCAAVGAEHVCEGCRGADACPVRPTLIEARDAVLAVLERITLADQLTTPVGSPRSFGRPDNEHPAEAGRIALITY